MTFGNKLDVKKLVNSDGLQIAWRARPIFLKVISLSLQGLSARLEASGEKTCIMPLRPVCLLKGQLELNASEIVQIM